MAAVSSSVSRETSSSSSATACPYDVSDLRISFSGAGFLGIYHGGVAAAFSHFLPNAHYSHCSGVSVGSMAAAALVGSVPISFVINAFLEACTHARTYTLGPWNPVYDLTDVLREKLHNILPDDIHIVARGRLSVSVTKVYDGSNTILTNFLSKSELIEALLCSAFVPVMSGFMPGHYRGQRIIDGGFSCNLIDHLDNTITVSPLAGDAHVCPIDDLKYRKRNVHRFKLAKHGLDLTLANLRRLHYCFYPQSVATIERLMEEGFRDGHRFLRKHGLTQCRQCLTIKSHVVHCRDTVACDVYSSMNVKLPRRLRKLYQREAVPSLTMVAKRVRDHSDQACDPDQMELKFTPSKKVRETKRAKEKQDLKPKRGALSSHLYSMIFKIVYYSPVVIAARWTYASTAYLTTLVMEQLGRVTLIPERLAQPRIIEELESLIGSLLGKALSEECYHKLSPSQAKEAKSRRAQVRGRKHLPYISCDLSIHQYMPLVEEDEFAANWAEPVAEVCSEAGSIVDGDAPSESSERCRLSRRSSSMKSEDGDEVEIYNIHMEVPEPHSNWLAEPTSEREARDLMTDNLIKVLQSNNASRVVSRLASRRESRHSSLVHSRSGSRSSLVNVGTQEALENLIKVTEDHDSICSYYYTDENGDIVTMNMFDITDTNPDDIIIDNNDDNLDLSDDDDDEETNGLRTVDSSLDMSEVQRRLRTMNKDDSDDV